MNGVSACAAIGCGYVYNIGTCHCCGNGLCSITSLPRTVGGNPAVGAAGACIKHTAAALAQGKVWPQVHIKRVVGYHHYRCKACTAPCIGYGYRVGAWLAHGYVGCSGTCLGRTVRGVPYKGMAAFVIARLQQHRALRANTQGIWQAYGQGLYHGYVNAVSACTAACCSDGYAQHPTVLHHNGLGIGASIPAVGGACMPGIKQQAGPGTKGGIGPQVNRHLISKRYLY